MNPLRIWDLGVWLAHHTWLTWMPNNHSLRYDKITYTYWDQVMQQKETIWKKTNSLSFENVAPTKSLKTQKTVRLSGLHYFDTWLWYQKIEVLQGTLTYFDTGLRPAKSMPWSEYSTGSVSTAAFINRCQAQPTARAGPVIEAVQTSKSYPGSPTTILYILVYESPIFFSSKGLSSKRNLHFCWWWLTSRAMMAFKFA